MDILTVVKSRCPKMDLVMAYANIQGEGAPGSMIRALDYLDRSNDVDVIILARGGGPSKDFMAFNDESLVRAIASISKPVITGIGHEEDNCLADLAADFRASTPTSAARAAIPDVQELRKELEDLRRNLDRSYNSYLMSLEIEEKEAKLGKKEEEIKQVLESVASSKSNLLKYKAIIAALIALLVFVIMVFLMGGFPV